MSQTPTVHILVTVNNPALADLSTLVFKTIRTGFPTARIVVDANGNNAEEALRKVEVPFRSSPSSNRIHHAAWIRRIVAAATGPIVILDPDIIFWCSVEDWTFQDHVLMAGRYVPRMWNEWAGCPSVPRLHTSMLWIPNPAALRTALDNRYSFANEPLGEYCPCDPWAPAVHFDLNRPTFWDVAANAFNMLPGRTMPFAPEMLDCYTHVNSPTFHDVFIHRLSDPQSYTQVLDLALKDPDRLRGFWRAEDNYYHEMSVRLKNHEQAHN